MTREEAIKIIDCYDIGFYDLSGEKIPADKLADAFDMAIEALNDIAKWRTWSHTYDNACMDGEMDDLISRAEAIEAIELVDWYHQNSNKDMVHGANSDEHQAWYKADDVYKALEAVPPADRPRGEWIPVSEKPKDEERTYLVQLDGGGMCSCRWTNVNPFWTDLTTEWHWCIFDIPQYSKVVAWMDLEPYKGGEDE